MQASRLITASTRTLSRRQPLSTTTTAPVVPRILDRRENETGPGGRGSDAGLKVAVFGASGFLGRYVCSHLGEFLVGLSVLFLLLVRCRCFFSLFRRKNDSNSKCFIPFHDFIPTSFGYLQPVIALDHKLTKNGSLVFATKLGGEVILGDDFEFYHAAEIGGKNGLRGFRNERFTGKRSFYQNIDLRMPLGGLRTSIIPIRFGITGSFDYGRVWLDNDSSKKWHNSYGGSIWVSGVEAITANIGYFNSSDGGRIVFALGFAF